MNHDIKNVLKNYIDNDSLSIIDDYLKSMINFDIHTYKIRKIEKELKLMFVCVCGNFGACVCDNIYENFISCFFRILLIFRCQVCNEMVSETELIEEDDSGLHNNGIICFSCRFRAEPINFEIERYKNNNQF